MAQGPVIGVGDVLVFGGAFDPPHLGHIKLPQQVRREIGAGLILFMPAAAPPLKDGPVAGANERIAMLRAAIDRVPDSEICSLEMRRGGVSYTVDTLRSLRLSNPDSVGFHLLIGADQAAQFHKWRDYEEIIRIAEPVVMIRPPLEDRTSVLGAMRDHWSAVDLDRWEGRFVDVEQMDISSSRLREALRTEGVDSPLAKQWIPAPVLDVIRASRLYVD
jgi:nicotinate-nucleotide adenylyltransferase